MASLDVINDRKETNQMAIKGEGTIAGYAIRKVEKENRDVHEDKRENDEN